VAKTTPWRVETSKRFAFDLLQSVIDQPTPGRGKPRRRRVKKGKRAAWAELRKMAGL